ncbi:flagellar hook capping FlgD N-terminal domain-containing protein [Pedococcus sp. KACC 23699]|uniref:Flagellar hook capping FlgD N-terminal domain-containing protein n=1 Tax=Pedococcus sp. KACC 23699 TaxID=3149228 RepID=A0AAU7JZJ1_9MICO
MTTPIGSSTAAAAAAFNSQAAANAAAATSTTGATASSSGTDLSGDAFLKLLVAQLKYQDPSKPVDSAAFMAQTAQMQMVETLHELVAQNASVLAGQNSLNALSLVGRSVTYSVGSATASGTVDSVKLTAAGPKLIVNHTEVPLSTVTEVAATTSTAPSSSPTTPAKD